MPSKSNLQKAHDSRMKLYKMQHYASFIPGCNEQIAELKGGLREVRRALNTNINTTLLSSLALFYCGAPVDDNYSAIAIGCIGLYSLLKAATEKSRLCDLTQELSYANCSLSKYEQLAKKPTK